MKKMIKKTLLIALCATAGQIMASDNGQAAEEQTAAVEKQTWQSHAKNAGKNLAYCVGPAAIGVWCGSISHENMRKAIRFFQYNATHYDYHSPYCPKGDTILGSGLARIGLLAMLAVTGKLLWNAGHSAYKAIKQPEEQLVENTPYISTFGKWTSAVAALPVTVGAVAATLIGIGSLDLRSIEL